MNERMRIRNPLMSGFANGEGITSRPRLPMLDFFLHPKTGRTDWGTIAIFLATVASFAGAAILWMQHPG